MGALMGFMVFGPMMDIKNLILLSGGFSRKFVLRLCLTSFCICGMVVFLAFSTGLEREPAMTKNCWNSQALAEISCYLAFAGAMLYLVRSGRYLSYVTPKLAPYLCFSAAVMVVWALSSLGRVFRIQYRKHIAHCFVLAIPLLLLLPHDTVGLRDISDSAGLLNGSMVSGAAGGGGGIPAAGNPIPSNQEDTEAEGARPGRGIRRRLYDPGCLWRPLEIHGYNSRQQTITVSNEEFYDWLCVFYTDIEQLEGFQVTMTGQIYKKHAGYGGQRVCSRTAGHGLLRGGPVPLRPVLHLRQRVRTGERFLGHGDRRFIPGEI